eukprot:CAMPEP_0197293340 /NCGR_PEP_ID=MMETSP0890-20130614/27927_1 /TAXON_ID=44058 ORGANISM="Aureoumbra lagunensis, Strain CCMP1510" /NCGR_SAMPLE_ID=MMETSP0890 /ASSEMBLY_ACC=CAM_ASM_000533 /LENGTH=1153 /DNA_ID=CAMNT_0042767987 /DNA_START=778 /DNA_END=4239 /DNA_ORIENTATION=+
MSFGGTSPQLATKSIRTTSSEDFIDEDDEDDDQTSGSDDRVSSIETSCPIRKVLWRILRSRLCLEVRVKEFSFGNPIKAKFVRDQFVRGTDIEITVSARICDLLRIVELLKVWSWRPRDQPIRRQPDGGCTQYGIIKDNKTKTWKNRRILGVLEIERFEMCDASIAFEKAQGKLNVNEIGAALARGEIRKAAKRNDAAKRLTRSKIFSELLSGKLSIEVFAARHLDAAARGHKNGDRIVSTGGRLRQGLVKVSAPSTFVKVTVRGRTKRSNTILRSANPSFGDHIAEFFVSDPSAVIHIAIYEELPFGDALIAQFSTTLKQLILEPERVDGGNKALEDLLLDTSNNKLILDRKGFVPLRDAKWRVFHTEEIEPDRNMDKYEEFEFSADSSDLSLLAASIGPIDEQTCAAGTTSKTGTLLNKPPPPGYPAVLLRIRWRETDTQHEDDDKHDSALEQIKINTTESVARCGNPDAIRAMLASFPYLLDITGGFCIRGTALCHMSDLFSGSKLGFLEKRKEKRGGFLLPKDWRAARRKAITLTRIEVAFPNTGDLTTNNNGSDATNCRIAVVSKKVQHTFSQRGRGGTTTVDNISEEKTSSGCSNSSHGVQNLTLAELFAANDGCPIQSGFIASVLRGSVQEVPGLLTIDAALVRLVRGLAGRVASDTGKLSASLGQLAASLGFSTLTSTITAGLPSWSLSVPGTTKILTNSNNTTTQQTSTVIQKVSDTQDLDRVDSDVINETSTSALPPFLKTIKRTHSRMKRQVTLALGLGSKQTHKRLDGRDMDAIDSKVVCSGFLEKRGRGWKRYHFELKASILYYYLDKSKKQSPNIVDLRRVVSAVDPARKYENPADLLFISLVDGLLIIYIRLDDGYVGRVCLRQSSNEDQIPLEKWRDSITDAVLRSRQQARLDVLAIVNEYSKSQRATLRREMDIAKQVSQETAIHGESPITDESVMNDSWHTEDSSGEETKMDPTLVPDIASEPRGSFIPINGGYTLSRRGSQLDAVLVSEVSTFATRVAASATCGLVWINIHDTERAFVYYDDGFMAHRFVGPLNIPVKTHFLADKPESVLCSETCSLTNNGTVLVLSMASLETGQIFYRTQWRLRSNKRNQLEQRTRFTTMAAVPTSATLFKKDYDLYSRMSPEDAANLEVTIQ